MKPTVKGIDKAAEKLESVVKRTPLERNDFLSEEFGANIFLKREDLQTVRSYKIRGAYNYISSLNPDEIPNGIACASAGNHAQGVALSCAMLNIKGTIFMPTTTPKQKIRQVARIGGNNITIRLTGDTYDDAKNAALSFCEEENLNFVHPFDTPLVIEGQGTVGKEVWEDMVGKIDFVFIPIGGGGLAAGLGMYLHDKDPNIKLIGCEPLGAPAMYETFKKGKIVELKNIDSFVDGAAVKRVGKITSKICKQILTQPIVLVPEGRICTRILNLYNRSAIVAEPAGALSIAALDQYKKQIKNKNVVCILSGGNNDIDRMPDIKERSLIYEGIKHYFILKFPQRAGALKEFVNDVLGEDDDITLFEYTKKNNREAGPALVGIELKDPSGYEPLKERMKAKKFNFTELKENPVLFSYLI